MPRVLEKTAYDAMKKSATRWRGIGGGAWFTQKHRPLCGTGHAAAHDGIDPESPVTGPTERELNLAGIDEQENDTAVELINQARGKPWDARVSWTAYCKQTGLVRGN